ncbi:MAG TPA: glycosyltransferase family 1 protein [Candidatus Acidoferrum sp.]|nr:glycosyltransferase family 1 protein [Candidatus Acidoferrum sp.]
MLIKRYIDVTQLIHWPGRLTGIPRVMNELAVRFAKQPDTFFVAWVKEIQQFCEVDFLATMAQRGSGIVYIKAGQDTAKPSAEPQPQSAQLKKQTIRLAKGVLRRAGRLSPRLARHVEGELIRLRISQYKVAQWHMDDQLFIPWGEWWDERFTRHLLELRGSGIKLIQIIHDIGPTVCPQFFEPVAVSPADYNSKIVPAASLVLAVSHNTKRELTQWLEGQKLHVPKIEVFRLGEDLQVTKTERPHEEAFKHSGLKGNDFILSVGTIEAKKNHLLYYYAYKLAKVRNIKLPKLVIVGRKGWLGDMALALLTKDPEIKDNIIPLLDASDEELSWLYDKCLFSVLASFHEGWGIPIAESVSRGVPCLCSNTSSMVEVAEGFVEHFSPASPDELLAGIEHWLDPKKLQAARSKTKHYKQFSWNDSFDQITKLIKGNV